VDRPLRLIFRNITEKYEQLLQDSKFDANKKANQILKDVSELPNIDEERTDREFFSYLDENNISAKATDVKLLRSKFGETNEDAPEVYIKPLKPSSGVEVDTSLRDYERIPMKQDIDEYFEDNVKKFVPDAWMERGNDKVGCELPFNRLFYVYKPLRSTEEILRDLKELDKNSENDLATLLKEEEA
jgi:type I restriction enzyme M protein